MAATVNRVTCLVFKSTPCIPSRTKACKSILPLRQFHRSPISRASTRADSKNSSNSSKGTQPPYKFSIDDLAPEERSTYQELSPKEQAKWRDEAKQMHEHTISPEMDSMIQGWASQAAYEAQKEIPHSEMVLPTQKPGLFNYGEEEVFESGEDEEYQGDDINSLGHAELEQHRELREYARIAAYEMPLLSKYAKPWTPPKQDYPLRFRYTTYMGEVHPSAKKVVLEFCTEDLLLVLTPPQRTKLIKLCGPRYNPSTDIVKMSSEMFETQAQNKRYLGDLVDTLIAEAKNEADMFEDVPFDFRHHKERKEVTFPEEWRMNEERQARLESDRRARMIAERQREEQGRVLVGSQIIEGALKAMPVVDESRVLVEAQRDGRGKVGKGKQKLRR